MRKLDKLRFSTSEELKQHLEKEKCWKTITRKQTNESKNRSPAVTDHKTRWRELLGVCRLCATLVRHFLVDMKIGG